MRKITSKICNTPADIRELIESGEILPGTEVAYLCGLNYEILIYLSKDMLLPVGIEPARDDRPTLVPDSIEDRCARARELLRAICGTEKYFKVPEDGFYQKYISKDGRNPGENGCSEISYRKIPIEDKFTDDMDDMPVMIVVLPKIEKQKETI